MPRRAPLAVEGERASTTRSNVPGIKERLTKHNRRLHRMQAEWRATEQKLQERREDKAADEEDQEEEETLLWAGVEAVKRKKKGKVKGSASGVDDEDPWKVLDRKRKDTQQKNLQDVVVAPPVLPRVKNMFKIRQ